ncbi:MAG: amidase [Dehalococcoidia bacterium]|jgi:aspartyl-tRNA(Asn)/glutamyl-tRNA(Gln) amidotransferase subunit A|nr:amidase [Dehalococcoidia bacterium]
MAEVDLCYYSIAEASRRIEGGYVSPVALTEALFAQIDATDDRLNSYVRLMRESALEEAAAAQQRAESGERLGPLDGIGIGVKDLYDTAGVVTTGGTGVYRERVPATDSTCVRLLREAGAVMLGKTNTHELAYGGTTNNPHYGATHNPWAHDRVPGGSSGGSGAALAAGQALGALGSDTGGSIRIPAAFCGISGHKPTYGLVGRGGIIPLSLTLDHAGPMARTAEDCALMLNVLAGPDPDDLDSAMREPDDYSATLEQGVGQLRLAVIPSLVEGSTDAVLANFESSLDVLRGLGATIDTVEPMTGYSDWRGPLGSILAAEAAAYMRETLEQRPQLIGELVRNRLQFGLDIKAIDYTAALEQRKLVERQFERALGEFDAYVVPTSPLTAEPIEDGERSVQLKFRNTSTFDNTHQPSMSVPNGFDEDGLPTSLMITSALFDDAMALRIAHAYQQVTDFHTRRPNLQPEDPEMPRRGAV